MGIGEALLNFAKKHGLKVIEIIFGIGSPVTAISTIAKMIGLDDNATEIDVIEALKKDSNLVLKLKQMDLEKKKLELADVENARELDKLMVNHKDWFGRNFKSLYAMLVTIGVFAIIIFDMNPDWKMSEFVLGTVLGYGMNVVGYYFGSTEIDNKVQK